MIRVGVIGLGGIATGVHLPGIEKSKDLKLVAICDIIQTKLLKIGEQYKIPENRQFSDYNELLACQDIDAVCICTPNNLHFQMAMDAVSANKHYALEKPVTLNAVQAEMLAKRTAETGVENMVCFSYRFKASARYARELVQGGALGDIYHVQMQYFQSWGLPEESAPLLWRFEKSKAGSGALGDLGCHALDLVRFVTGREYTKIVSDADTYVKRRQSLEGDTVKTCDVDDYCNYLARMEGDISASFQITRFAFGRGNYQRMEIYGSRGALVYKLDENSESDELEICIGQPYGQLKCFTEVNPPSSCNADQMQAFADIINGVSDGTAATISDGYANQRVVDAIIASFESQRWIVI